MKRPTPLMFVFGALLVASFSLTLFGALKLCSVGTALDANVFDTRRALMEGAPVVVSFVPGGSGRTLRLKETATRSEAGVGILVFHFDNDAAVAVFDGTRAETLERGAGRTESTSPLNGDGRCVLHGHRDSAFQSLSRVKIGDLVTAETPEKRVTYHVSDVWITDPTDPAIYDTVNHRQLLLVTCYPFSFVGPAPQRCVVVLEESDMQTR